MDSSTHAHPQLLHSPFEISPDDIDYVCASEGFQVLRRYLAENANHGFCTFHSECDDQVRETWLLHRDLLHALLMPVVELFKRASALAQTALRNPVHEDLETAFGGEARMAFLWLQCFLTEEENWCRTRGCPACVTTATLSTESHIRLTIAASLLSTASIQSPPLSPVSTTSSLLSSPTSPTPTGEHNASSLSLPPLPHILPALREALSSDPFWGADYFPHLLARANILSASIQALISACIELESIALSQEPPKNGVVGRRVFSLGSSEEGEPGVKIRKGKMAKRQLRMKEEEMGLMRRCALQCWAALVVPPQMRRELLGKGERRMRSSTCP